VLAVVSDLLAIEAKGIHLSGAGIALVLAMCFLGPAPAVVIALTTIAVATARRMPPLPLLLHNLANYATLPLVGGLLARVAVDAGVLRTESRFALVVFGVYWTTILLSFGLIAVS